MHGALAPEATRYRLKPGASIDDVRFDNIFYADNAIKSYAMFARVEAPGQHPGRT